MPKGFTNGAASLSGRTNMKNQVMYLDFDEKKIEVKSPAADRSYFERTSRQDGYHRYAQRKLEKPNGNSFAYKYPENKLKLFPWITCENTKTGQIYSQVEPKDDNYDKEHHLLLKTSDNRTVKYHYRKHNIKKQEHLFIKGQTIAVDDPEYHYYIESIKSAHIPNEYYKYCKKSLGEGLHIQRKTKPNGNQTNYLETHYYHSGINHV